MRKRESNLKQATDSPKPSTPDPNRTSTQRVNTRILESENEHQNNSRGRPNRRPLLKASCPGGFIIRLVYSTLTGGQGGIGLGGFKMPVCLGNPGVNNSHKLGGDGQSDYPRGPGGVHLQFYFLAWAVSKCLCVWATLV